MTIRDSIAAYTPRCERETEEKRVMLDWIDRFPDNILTRENEFAHMTSSAMVFDPSMQYVLMAYHNIYRSWAWTGGHADGDADLYAVAVREVQEETGVRTLKPICLSPTSLDILTVNGHYKRGKWIPAHLHLCLCYSFIADTDQNLQIKPDENSGVQWLPITQLADYVSEPQMLPVYEKIIRQTKDLMK